MNTVYLKSTPTILSQFMSLTTVSHLRDATLIYLQYLMVLQITYHCITVCANIMHLSRYVWRRMHRVPIIIWHFEICVTSLLLNETIRNFQRSLYALGEIQMLPLATLNWVTRWLRIRRTKKCLLSKPFTSLVVFWGAVEWQYRWVFCSCCTIERHYLPDC
jgi:hypothetical protein